MNPKDTESRLMREREAAEYIGVKYNELAGMRRRGEGPRYRVTGTGRIWYTRAALDEWLDQQT